MLFTLGRRSMLAAAAWSAIATAEVSATEGARRAPYVRILGFDRGGLVPLPDGSTLLWDNNGNLQIRSALGVWAPKISLGVVITQVVSDPTGILVSATRYSGAEVPEQAVLLLGFDGSVEARWKVPRLTGIAGAGGQRWATTSSGGWPRPSGDDPNIDVEKEALPAVDKLYELVGGGTVLPRGAIEMNARVAVMSSGSEPARRVDCAPEHPVESAYHAAFCVASGPAPWRKRGRWDLLPFSCGPYLIEVYAREFPTGKPHPGDEPRLTVRQLADGVVAGKRTVSSGPAVACGGPGELLVGRDDVQGWSLPALEPLWRARAGRGRVTGLARVGDQILVSTSSGAFTMLRKPLREGDAHR